MFNTTQRFGLIYQDRMYVLEYKYREDKGVLNYLPFGIAAGADFIVDLTAENVIKHRFEIRDDWIKIGGIVASQMFNGVNVTSVDKLVEAEKRATKPKTFDASEDNIFAGE